jgi:Ca-activated chloride channel family protein
VDVVQAGTGRRALVLLSDGADRYSTATADDVLAHVRRTDVMVYPVAVGKREPPLFVELAAVTGGRSFTARDGAALDEVMRTIASDLHHQYLIGYTPVARGREPGSWRSLEVSVKSPGARVRARRGYVSN